MKNRWRRLNNRLSGIPNRLGWNMGILERPRLVGRTTTGRDGGKRRGGAVVVRVGWNHGRGVLYGVWGIAIAIVISHD